MFFFGTSSVASSQGTIKVSDFSYEGNPVPLFGFVPNDYFNEDPSFDLRETLLDSNNFRDEGKVSSSVEFKPFILYISSGFLVENSKRKFDVFFC